MADSPVQSEGPAQAHRSRPVTPVRPGPVEDSRLRSGWRTAGRLLLGGFLVFAGVSHLGWSREAFYAQVPPWLPLDRDFIVVASGLVEIALGLGLLLLSGGGWRSAGLLRRSSWRSSRATFRSSPRAPIRSDSIRTRAAESGCCSSRSWWCGPCGPRAPGGRGGSPGEPVEPASDQVRGQDARRTRTLTKHGYRLVTDPAKQRRPCSVSRTSSVELRGLEPLTPCMPCRCATSCATAPKSLGNLSCEGPSSLKQPVYLKLHFRFTRIGTPSRGKSSSRAFIFLRAPRQTLASGAGPDRPLGACSAAAMSKADCSAGATQGARAVAGSLADSAPVRGQIRANAQRRSALICPRVGTCPRKPARATRVGGQNVCLRLAANLNSPQIRTKKSAGIFRFRRIIRWS